MAKHDEPFWAEQVEEQLDHFLAQVDPHSFALAEPDLRLVKDLQALYTDDTPSGERVWTRLMERLEEQQSVSRSHSHQIQHTFPRERIKKAMPLSELNTLQSRVAPPRRQLQRVFALVAALLVAAVLVGSTVWALAALRQPGSTPGTVSSPTAPRKTATFTATPLPAGSVVYTQSSAPGTNISPTAAWSPDSKRIATLVINLQSLQTQLQIWDATTGGNRLTVPLVYDLNEVHWSPTGQYLALNNLQTIVIVDSQTGKIVNTIQYRGIAASHPSATSRVPLSSLIPRAGGRGFYSIGWTPDGRSLAVAASYTTYGNVELLNPVTGAVNATFSEHASSISDTLSFSSDGQYLAVSYATDSRIVVWQVSTQTIAFEQDDVQAEIIAWQPGTHNLARAVPFPSSIQLWNISTKKLLKTYASTSKVSTTWSPSSEVSFTWSPDGKALATYDNLSHGLSQPAINKVVIVDATSGVQIATYTSQHAFIESVFWSPNGFYLASAESASTGNQILVWTA